MNGQMHLMPGMLYPHNDKVASVIVTAVWNTAVLFLYASAVAWAFHLVS